MIIGKKDFIFGKRTYIMGILNVTPDSFSDGGEHNTVDSALFHVENMINQGADIIDIGGESTRPNHVQISSQEEINRVVPVIKAVRNKFPQIPISIDTYKSEVCIEAVNAGADIINDIWGLKYDSKIADIAYKNNIPVCIMHNRNNTNYSDIIKDIIYELKQSIDIAKSYGLKDIILDVGIGFGKTYEQNIFVLKNLDLIIKEFDYPMLLGTSRKSVIGIASGNIPPTERVYGTVSTTVIGIQKGCDIVRVHDVKENKMAAVMADAILRWIMDTIKIDDIEIYAFHGCLNEENVLGQKFYVSAVLYLDLEKAGKSDDINMSVNYAEVCENIKRVMTENRFNLIEKCAEEVASELLYIYDIVKAVDISVKKPQAPISMSFSSLSVNISRKKHIAYLGLGGNIGDVKSNLDIALKSLNTKHTKVKNASKYYRTSPVGNTEQPYFINMAAEIETILSPKELIDFTMGIEKSLKRERNGRWTPRTMDIDILLYDDIVTNEKSIVIPHIEMHKRLFVLLPLSEIAPYAIHPLLNKRIVSLKHELNDCTQEVLLEEWYICLYTK